MSHPDERRATGEDIAMWDYEFYVWPHERNWEPAVYDLFRHYPRVSIPAGERWFEEFRNSLERCGFTLREATRVPHYEPEDFR